MKIGYPGGRAGRYLLRAAHGPSLPSVPTPPLRRGEGEGDGACPGAPPRGEAWGSGCPPAPLPLPQLVCGQEPMGETPSTAGQPGVPGRRALRESPRGPGRTGRGTQAGRASAGGVQLPGGRQFPSCDPKGCTPAGHPQGWRTVARWGAAGTPLLERVPTAQGAAGPHSWGGYPQPRVGLAPTAQGTPEAGCGVRTPRLGGIPEDRGGAGAPLLGGSPGPTPHRGEGPRRLGRGQHPSPRGSPGRGGAGAPAG